MELLEECLEDICEEEFEEELEMKRSRMNSCGKMNFVHAERNH
jgi:hypothetical protein